MRHLLCLTATTALAGTVVLVRLPRVVVAGSSMAPTLAPGERLAVVPVRARPGRLVVVRDPRDRRRVLVKRAGVVAPGGLQVHGDNPAASTDSRHFGAVPDELVVGRPLYRYAPPERAGWVWRA